jgi:hypothetical protein
VLVLKRTSMSVLTPNSVLSAVVPKKKWNNWWLKKLTLTLIWNSALRLSLVQSAKVLRKTRRSASRPSSVSKSVMKKKTSSMVSNLDSVSLKMVSILDSESLLVLLELSLAKKT